MSDGPEAMRVLVVDDEPLARAHLTALLEEAGGVEVVGECGDGREAVRLIVRDSPDLVFLDVQMPELDGFGVLQAIGADRMPPVIFVTAYDEYAMQAFDVAALAYLLKPIARERLAVALDRARILVRAGSTGDIVTRLGTLLEKLDAAEPRAGRIPLKVDGRLIFVGVDEIDWVEADDNHVKVHAGQRTHPVRSTMAGFERRLPAGRFLRVHRSAIVNVRRIVEVQPWFAGDYVFILAGGLRITSGRSYRENIREFMERQL